MSLPARKFAAHQVMLENLREHAFGKRGVGIELDRQASLSARGLAHARLKQHIGQLQVVHGRIGILRDQRAIAGQRFFHFAIAQQRRPLRLKVHHDRRTGDQIGHLIAQRRRFGHGVAALHRVEDEMRQHRAILVGGKLLRQQRGANRMVASLGSSLGTKPAGGMRR